MAIKEYNFDVIEGDTWDATLICKDSNGALIDFSSYSNFIMEVRDKEGGSILCATAELGNGITIVSTGKIYVEFTPEKTKNFNLPRSKFQLQSIDGGGKKRTLVQGWFAVKPRTIF